ncbi:2-amino-4-hydroxy-6-hydroxymethyldihydropteridine diphosphokinase [Crocinitomix catalasitica]|uniref:2-amino-4-hydroxy-6- hydroxymethyldihydropteridine diphosphokinase n=1 Tax=Crocinitomix catalasitica TaxID=184607 RepID=UPI000564360D|nr:2-amino-4-hydroxy-6-hydroxymethyldihydropteridine diphosphokinase [Crocinitomix catalasitica]
MQKKVYLSLGSNLGDKSKNLELAYRQLRSDVGTIVKISKIIETEPWGYESDELFFNVVIEMNTTLSLVHLFKKIKEIEQRLGRSEKISSAYEDRIIDIDIIDYNSERWIDDDLIVPHAKMHLRLFVLIPLFELNANWQHPALNLSINEMKAKLL